MVARQEEFNACFNLLVMAKMGNLRHIEHSGLHQLLNPWMGDQVRLLPSCLCQVSVGCDHSIVLPISEIEFVVLQQWDLSQMALDYAYSLRNVLGDQHVLIVSWNVVAVNRASQWWNIVW
jgi:hypothetical protein